MYSMDPMDLEAENASILSGRQTPRSAISVGSSTTENRPDLIDSTELSNNTNITDRFGKFEIGTALEKKRAYGNPGMIKFHFAFEKDLDIIL